jgi:hypothetical protein
MSFLDFVSNIESLYILNVRVICEHFMCDLFVNKNTQIRTKVLLRRSFVSFQITSFGVHFTVLMKWSRKLFKTF